jgi:hypothetical protein
VIRARWWGALAPGLAALVATVALGGCSREINADGDLLRDGGGVQGGGSSLDGGTDAGLDPFGNPIGPAPTYDASVDLQPVGANSDAFFINDPPPPYCGPDEVDPGDPITGSVDCPSDKNRQGCPCENAGEVAACWPGKRIHRDHGICQDGTTMCTATQEFGLLWGPCEEYVLPMEGALAGPDACRCFSAGTWKLSNLSPCIYQGAEGIYLYSSTLSADGKIQCGSNVPDPPPRPEEDWSTSTLNVDCAGQFELCYTIKAGDVDDPKPTDCVVMQTCVDVWYPEAGQDLALDALPSWVSTDTDCGGQFDRGGGYGEMSVIGESIECDVVDDGMGNPYVFHRTDYCPPSCQATPTTPECMACQTGGSGMFN